MSNLGIPWSEVTFQVRMMVAVGCRLYIVTAATGGLLDGMRSGCLCLLDGHFRQMARVDPLRKLDVSEKTIEYSRGNHEFWNSKMVELAKQVAHEQNIQLFCGPYVWVSGPTFETPLEVHKSLP
jgi:purine-nucleoside phosphorylase